MTYISMANSSGSPVDMAYTRTAEGGERAEKKGARGARQEIREGKGTRQEVRDGRAAREEEEGSEAAMKAASWRGGSAATKVRTSERGRGLVHLLHDER